MSLTDDEAGRMLRRLAHTRAVVARLADRVPVERVAVVQLAGGEPIAVLICRTEVAARDAIHAAGLSADDVRIVAAREM